jgi:hypothetical protein
MPTRDLIETAVGVLADLKREFGRDLTASLLVELHIALEPHLRLLGKIDQPGFELVGRNGKLYQLNQRDPKTLNVDLNSFDFDCLILMLTLLLRLLNLPPHDSLSGANKGWAKQLVDASPTTQSGLSA